MTFLKHVDSATTTLHTETPKHPCIVPLAGIAIVMFGTMNMLLLRYIAGVQVPQCPQEQCDLVHFRAPIFEQLINALSQALWLPIFYVSSLIKLRRRSPPPPQDDLDLIEPGERTPPGERTTTGERTTATPSMVRRPAPKGVWVLPALLDLCGSISLLIALSLVSASSVAIMRNMSVLVCACLSICILNRSYKLYNWIGIVVISLGLTLTAITAAYGSQEESRWEGQLLILVSTVFSVLQYLEQERLSRKYSYNAVSATGWSGLFQTVMVLCLCLLAFVSGLEDLRVVVWQVSTRPELIAALTAVAVSVAGFMAASFTVTKADAALLACILHAMRQIVLWTFEVGLGWEPFTWPSLVGLVLSVLGFVVFRGWLPFSCPWCLRECHLSVSVLETESDDPPRPKAQLEKRLTSEEESRAERSTDVGSSLMSDIVPKPNEDRSTYIRVDVMEEWILRSDNDFEVDSHGIPYVPTSSFDYLGSRRQFSPAV